MYLGIEPRGQSRYSHMRASESLTLCDVMQLIIELLTD